MVHYPKQDVFNLHFTPDCPSCYPAITVSGDVIGLCCYPYLYDPDKLSAVNNCRTHAHGRCCYENCPLEFHGKAKNVPIL